MYKVKHISIDSLIYFLIIVIVLGICTSFDFSNGRWYVLLSFFINGIFVLYKCISAPDGVSISRNIYIYSLIFMTLAPLSQYLSNTILWQGNGMYVEYTDMDYFFANVLLLVFYSVFEFGYKRTKKLKHKHQKNYSIRNTKALRIPLVLSTICLMVMILTDGLQRFGGTMISAQLKNMVMFIPVECLVICMAMYKKKRIKQNILIVCGLEVAILYVLYSSSMARFVFLGALMVIVSFVLWHEKNKSLYFAVYFFGFVFIFSAIRGHGFGGILNFDFIDFNHVDYDAYQIFLLTINYVKEFGISWGQNILSVLFCFVPRSIATWRFENTGGMVIEHYGSWFTNVSCPIPAEFYFAFGILGIIVLGYFLGAFVKKLDLAMRTQEELMQCLFCIFSGLSVYLMRGAMLPTVSFTIGILVSFYILIKATHIRIG